MSRIGLTNRSLWPLMIILAGVSAPVPVLAQEYPSKPIRWIVPYAPGGTSDFLARIIGQKLTEALGHTVVIDNRAGASGNIGTDVVAKSPADGYTMLLVATTFALNPSVFRKLPFDSEKDFAAVTNILWQPYVMAVHPSLPVRSVRQLIALARAKPGELNYSSGGSGTSGHIAAELFWKMAGGVKLTHVPYRSLGPALLALVAGEVHLTFASVLLIAPYLKSGRIRVIGVASRERIATMPEVPTISEAGVTGYEEGNWQGVLVPSRTPRPIITKLNHELVRILRTPDVTEQILRVGANIIANTPDEFAALIRADSKKYADLIKAVGITVD